MSPHLDCYSVGAADISIEDFAVGLAVVILTVFFPSPDRNREIQQTKFQMAVSLQRPRGSMGFTQYSCLAQLELLLYSRPILHCKNSMVILTNKNGYLSFTFVLSTLGTEQRYKECVGYHPGGTER